MVAAQENECKIISFIKSVKGRNCLSTEYNECNDITESKCLRSKSKGRNRSVLTWLERERFTWSEPEFPISGVTRPWPEPKMVLPENERNLNLNFQFQVWHEPDLNLQVSFRQRGHFLWNLWQGFWLPDLIWTEVFLVKLRFGSNPKIKFQVLK